MSDDISKQAEQYRNQYGWQSRLQHFREHLDNLPDQRRRIETEDGVTAGPRALIEQAIDDAERAGHAGDLDAFAQAMHRIVGDFWEAGLPILDEGFHRARQSKRAKGKRTRPPALWKRAFIAMLEEWPDLDAATMRDHLDGYPRIFDERVEVSVDDEGNVIITDLIEGTQDNVPKEYQSTYLRRAKG